jgi:hypothetical protein
MRYRRLGLTLLGVGGAILTLAGGFLIAAGASGEEGVAFPAAFLGTAGAVVLIIALVFAVMAATAGLRYPETGAKTFYDTAYQKRLEHGLAWVRKRRAQHTGKLEDLVAKACIKFSVQFNDIWMQLE